MHGTRLTCEYLPFLERHFVSNMVKFRVATICVKVDTCVCVFVICKCEARAGKIVSPKIHSNDVFYFFSRHRTRSKRIAHAHSRGHTHQEKIKEVWIQQRYRQNWLFQRDKCKLNERRKFFSSWICQLFVSR